VTPPPEAPAPPGGRRISAGLQTRPTDQRRPGKRSGPLTAHLADHGDCSERRTQLRAWNRRRRVASSRGGAQASRRPRNSASSQSISGSSSSHWSWSQALTTWSLSRSLWSSARARAWRPLKERHHLTEERRSGDGPCTATAFVQSDHRVVVEPVSCRARVWRWSRSLNCLGGSRTSSSGRTCPSST